MPIASCAPCETATTVIGDVAASIWRDEDDDAISLGCLGAAVCIEGGRGTAREAICNVGWRRGSGRPLGD